jgi:2-(1,2-epoxy-1,2-dihydrophenyl)acetyl-CoA isomerase
LIFTGGMISAERGERLGLFNRVVPAAQLEAAARGFAGEISAAPAGVLADAKRVLRRSLDVDAARKCCSRGRGAAPNAFDSPDSKEGITAFLNKRAPRFNRHTDQANGNGPNGRIGRGGK